jgi:hypothetical protein
MKIERFCYGLAAAISAVGISLVLYTSYFCSAYWWVAILSAVLLAIALALVWIAGRDPRTNTDAILLLLSLWYALRRPFTVYRIGKRYSWVVAHLHDWSVRLRGNRFLSVAKGDFHCTTYWIGHEYGQKPVDNVFEAVVPNQPGVWGRGWLHAHILNEEGRPYLLDGDVATHYIYGHVRWERRDSANP